jgi:hypothetical protein
VVSSVLTRKKRRNSPNLHSNTGAELEKRQPLDEWRLPFSLLKNALSCLHNGQNSFLLYVLRLFAVCLMAFFYMRLPVDSFDYVGLRGAAERLFR